ncbi:MAG: ATP/GTP-binding protein [Rudaea sp.]|nr:ATP/GTP-binding protein [Rudaea sp.]MBR0344872.1 ATP/GTP-binding protein [Rudaea sp.]
MKEYKLIFTGRMGAGKTTAIAAISEIPPVQTDVTNNDRPAHAKATTTVALDYGEVTLPHGDKLRLYGTPGQSRFDFMWKILSEGALGVIVLIDNSAPDPLADMREYLDAFRDIVSSSRAIVGVGRCDTHPVPGIDSFCEAAKEMALSVPVMSVDVRRREDVLLMLEVLFHQIEAAEADEALS